MNPTRSAAALLLALACVCAAQEVSEHSEPSSTDENKPGPTSQHGRRQRFIVPDEEKKVYEFTQRMTVEQEAPSAAAILGDAVSALQPSSPIGPKPPTHAELQVQRAKKFNEAFGQGSFEKIDGFSKKCEPPDCNKFATMKILMGAHDFVDLKTEVETGKIKEDNPQYGVRLGGIKRGMREGIRTMTPTPGVKKEYETELNDISQPIIRVVFSPEERERMAGNIARRNDSPPSWANLGRTYQDVGKPDQAREAYDTALEKDPKNETALVGRAQLSFANGDYSGAARDASAALKINPENKVAHTTLMLSQGRGGYQDGGAVAGGAAGEGGPGAGGGSAAGSSASGGFYPGGGAAAAPATPAMTAKADGLTLEAKRQLSVGDPKGAVASLQKAVELNPRNAQAYSLASIAHNRLKDYPAALAAAEAGLKLAPNSPVLLNSKSFALARMKQFQGALEAADYALSINPKDSMAHFNRAAALKGLGDRIGMIDSLRSAALFDPQFQPVLDAALKMPEDSDVFLLLPGESKEVPGKGSGPGAGNPWRNWLLAAGAGAVLLFGVLIARGSKPASPAAPVRSRAMPSNLAGKYEVGAELGSGGMGVVYEGKDTSLDRPVAIKRMREEIRWDQKERERFVAEARLVAKLRHPNIVEIHEIVEQDGEVYLVFELVSGLTLYETIGRERKLGFNRARDLMRGIASALDYAHGRKVIHRDLKPGNVMIDGEGRVRVMDFGIARLAKEAMTRHSTTGTIVGTPPYMAPEQEQGVTRQESDVFAMASCLYEAVTGRLPFNGEGAGLLMNKLNKAFVPPSKIVPELPAGLDAVMARALEPNPELRYPSAGTFLKDLEKLS